MSTIPTLRRDLRPGDLGRIVESHGRLYAAEYGMDATFEASVARSLARAAFAGFPRAGEGLWVAELDGRFAGSLGLTDEGDGEGRIRWVLLEPAARGHGLAGRMLDEALAVATEAGQRRVTLDTFDELRAAGAMYRERGFAVAESERRVFGGREVTMQRYELPTYGRTSAVTEREVPVV